MSDEDKFEISTQILEYMDKFDDLDYTIYLIKQNHNIADEEILQLINGGLI